MRGMLPLHLFIAVALGVAGLAAQPSPLAELPKVNVANFFPAVREQVQKAYDAARTNPQNARAVGELGMILDSYEQYDSALVCYGRASQLDPSSFRWTYLLGWVEVALGRNSEAAAVLREALQLNPSYLPARLKLAEALLAAGKFEESSAIYQRVVRNYPDLPAAHYGLGRIQAVRRNDKAAAASLEKACELFPPYGAAHYALALVYRKLGENEKARKHLRLYEQNRTSVPAVEDPLRTEVYDLNRGPLGHMRRGLELEEAGKIDEAIAEQEKALEADPKLVQVHINLVGLYGKKGQLEPATQHYQAALGLNPDQAEAYYNYGVLLVRSRKNQEAEQAFRRVLAINPYHPEAHNNLGVLLEQQGRLDEALAEFEQAIANLPSYPLAHFHAGRILVNEGKYEAALRQFQAALKPEDENTPRCLYALGATYVRVGDREKALQYLRQARDAAAARHQTQLVESIERDLATLGVVTKYP